MKINKDSAVIALSVGVLVCIAYVFIINPWANKAPATQQPLNQPSQSISSGAVESNSTASNSGKLAPSVTATPDCDPNSSNEAIRACQPFIIVNRAVEKMDVSACGALKETKNLVECTNSVLIQKAAIELSLDTCHNALSQSGVISDTGAVKDCTYRAVVRSYLPDEATPEKFCANAKNAIVKSACKEVTENMYKNK